MLRQQIGTIAAGLGAWLLTVSLVVTRVHWAPLRMLGRCTHVLAIVLYPTALEHSVGLLNCQYDLISLVALNFFDGGSTIHHETSPGSGGTVRVPVLVSDPFYVCWAAGGSQRPAGIFACISLIFYSAALPAVTFYWVWNDAWLAQELKRLRDLQQSEKQPQQLGSDQCGTARCAKRCSRARSEKIGPPRVLHSALGDGLEGDSEAASMRASLTVNPLVSRPAINSDSGSTGGEAAVAPSQTSNAILAPFLSGYRPGAWYAKHLELSLLVILAVTQALLTRPATLPLVVAKAVLVGLPTLAMCVFIIVVSPYPPVSAWKRWVRVGFLSISVGCTTVNAAASALDLGAAEGASDITAFIGGASYALFTGCCIVGALLVFGFTWTLVKNAKAERAAALLRAAPATVAARHGSGSSTRTMPPQQRGGGRGGDKTVDSGGSPAGEGTDSGGTGDLTSAGDSSITGSLRLAAAHVGSFRAAAPRPQRAPAAARLASWTAGLGFRDASMRTVLAASEPPTKPLAAAAFITGGRAADSGSATAPGSETSLGRYSSTGPQTGADSADVVLASSPLPIRRQRGGGSSRRVGAPGPLAVK
jgi:hypothetical protein